MIVEPIKINNKHTIFISYCKCKKYKAAKANGVTRNIIQYNLFKDDDGILTISCPFCSAKLKYFIK